ncbi:HD domain-containing protein [Chitinophaga japonensis]|uniref:HD domain-containing protein n=1 Tax=Chitinophaga japonensis TaxID=104662 RepID=A0A562T6G1_CHIJA|nr:HD domain-containing protein [Chitinophaga japonensis]TWI89129.1 HD domain-containing protein [Chitinophaga japonensis]
MEALLEQVKDFARQAHGEQTRKYTPEPYIVHPVRVMEICRAHQADTAMLAAALLHDVLEDTPVNKQAMKDFLDHVMNAPQATRTLQLVVELTDVYTRAAYPRWNRRKRKAMETARLEKISAAAQTVKYADIVDNCKEIVHHDPDFAKVFLRECKALLKKMTRGHQQLYQKAVALVDENLARLD